MSAVSTWLSLAKDNEGDEAFKLYWELIKIPESQEFLTANDTIILAVQVQKNLETLYIIRAKEIINFARINQKRLSQYSTLGFAFFIYQEMAVHQWEQGSIKTLKAAKEIMSQISEGFKSDDVVALNNQPLVDHLEKNASKGIKAAQEYGCNQYVQVKYKQTGYVYRAKYKTVSEAFANGIIELVSTD